METMKKIIHCAAGITAFLSSLNVGAIVLNGSASEGMASVASLAMFLMIASMGVYSLAWKPDSGNPRKITKIAIITSIALPLASLFFLNGHVEMKAVASELGRIAFALTIILLVQESQARVRDAVA